MLFLEYFPHVMADWLLENAGETERMLDQLRITIAFFRSKGVIHFDAHFWNIMTDGERPYLTDFGLVLDHNFALSNREQLFFQQNTHYDYALVLNCLHFTVDSAYSRLSEADKKSAGVQYGIPEGAEFRERTTLLLENIEQVQADGILKLAVPYSRSVTKIWVSWC
ncbi:MAG: hypothetical protein LC772_07110 [Chloroflexi bacterium]|nr:hypothetical protein [Chloroflexota bacterium]